mmetsp:Transcript_548/g.809  ORF Transcript_548/g.809 Transcript_548/m.809 type:complete len:257 (+) Transcript_548:200-970(+)
MTDIILHYKPTIFKLEFKNALDMKSKLLTGTLQLECNTIIQSHIDSCPGGWCPLTYPSHYNFIEQVLPWLQNNTARLKCLKMHKGFKKLYNQTESKQVNIVWHVRTGDLSLHTDISYFNNILNSLVGIFGIKLLHLVFESQHPLPSLKATFPRAIFNIAKNITSTVCNFLTCDVFISSGSTMAAVLAFTQPLHPIIVEEKRKEVNWASFGPQNEIRQPHMFPKTMALHVFNNSVGDPSANFSKILRAVMYKKLGWK